MGNSASTRREKQQDRQAFLHGCYQDLAELYEAAGRRDPLAVKKLTDFINTLERADIESPTDKKRIKKLLMEDGVTEAKWIEAVDLARKSGAALEMCVPKLVSAEDRS